MGGLIPQCGRFESDVFHGVPNPGTSVVPTRSVLLCVARQCAEPVDACTSHPKKSSLGDRPIYDFHYNIYFSRHRLHCVRPKPPAIV